MCNKIAIEYELDKNRLYVFHNDNKLGNVTYRYNENGNLYKYLSVGEYLLDLFNGIINKVQTPENTYKYKLIYCFKEGTLDLPITILLAYANIYYNLKDELLYRRNYIEGTYKNVPVNNAFYKFIPIVLSYDYSWLNAMEELIGEVMNILIDDNTKIDQGYYLWKATMEVSKDASLKTAYNQISTLSIRDGKLDVNKWRIMQFHNLALNIYASIAKELAIKAGDKLNDQTYILEQHRCIDEFVKENLAPKWENKTGIMRKHINGELI